MLKLRTLFYNALLIFVSLSNWYDESIKDDLFGSTIAHTHTQRTHARNHTHTKNPIDFQTTKTGNVME